MVDKNNMRWIDVHKTLTLHRYIIGYLLHLQPTNTLNFYKKSKILFK